ncbi:MAG: metalloregulator ArsR/SmtB family transcription factor [Hyphomicrobiales bacterium]
MKKSNTAMVPSKDEKLDLVFHALSDTTRRSIVSRLAEANGTVSALAEPFDMSLNAVSKHLKVLENAKLIDREIVGRTSVCSLKADVLHDAMSWIDQYTTFWGEALDGLERHMENQFGDPTHSNKLEEN